MSAAAGSAAAGLVAAVSVAVGSVVAGLVAAGVVGYRKLTVASNALKPGSHSVTVRPGPVSLKK